ncbi:MAG: hypothetical protein U0271_13630 [Polyangiaceae bacterium]
MSTQDIFDEHHVPAEPLLRRLVSRALEDEAFRADLSLCAFEPYPGPADEVDCTDPWLFIVAMDGTGNAYGLYLHPRAVKDGVAPWVYWDHEDDALVALGDNTDMFVRGFLRAAARGMRDTRPLERARAVLKELGAELAGPTVDFDRSATSDVDWLPVPAKALEPLAAYRDKLATEPKLAERGLLGWLLYHRSREARGLLAKHYSELGWSPLVALDD